jgi:hypothetical protein
MTVFERTCHSNFHEYAGKSGNSWGQTLLHNKKYQHAPGVMHGGSGGAVRLHQQQATGLMP